MKDKQEKQNEVFIKLSVLAIKEGNVLAQISPDCWHVLTAIASFMDEEGNCCPTYDQLAKLTGVSKNAVMGRVKKLLNIRLMDGSPVITREKTFKNGRPHSVYKIMPGAGFYTADFNEQNQDQNQNQGQDKTVKTVNLDQNPPQGVKERIIERERIIYN